MTPVVEAELASTLSLSAYGNARSTIEGAPLSAEEVRKTNAYWRACKYLALGHDLPAGQSSAEGSSETRAHQEPPARTLGLEPRPRIHVHPYEPADQEA